mgnify:CR=1 FL=1
MNQTRLSGWKIKTAYALLTERQVLEYPPPARQLDLFQTDAKGSNESED